MTFINSIPQYESILAQILFWILKKIRSWYECIDIIIIIITQILFLILKKTSIEIIIINFIFIIHSIIIAIKILNASIVFSNISLCL